MTAPIVPGGSRTRPKVDVGQLWPGGVATAIVAGLVALVGADAARVVVAGVGFGGLAIMAGLARAGARVTLVDRNVYSTFQPLLYQVAIGGLNPSNGGLPGPRPGAPARRQVPSR